MRLPPPPHLLIVVDIKWIGVRVGAGYYDINNDAYRPAFIDLIVMNRYRISWEFARITRLCR